MSGLVDTSRTGRQTWRDDVPVALAAAAAGAVVWAVARLAGVEVDVRSGGGTRAVGPVSVIVTAVVVTVVGGALLRILVRRLAHGLRWWTATALVALVLSLLGPASAASPGAGAALAAMHLAVGAVVVVGLRRRAVA